MNINGYRLSYGRGYVCPLQYHIVWCTGYRRKVLTAGADEDCKELLSGFAEEYSFRVPAMEVMPERTTAGSLTILYPYCPICTGGARNETDVFISCQDQPVR
jgi:hypothetical protein